MDVGGTVQNTTVDRAFPVQRELSINRAIIGPSTAIIYMTVMHPSRERRESKKNEISHDALVHSMDFAFQANYIACGMIDSANLLPDCTVLITYLLQAADGAGLSHEGTVHAIHPPMNTQLRPADDHVGGHLKQSTQQ